MDHSALMSPDELNAFYGKLDELTEKGSEQDVRAHINTYFPKLPQEVKDEIIFHSFASALADEIKEATIIADMQEKSAEAIEALMAMKKELEEGEQGAQTAPAQT